jgi:hypothetical protein
MNKIQIRYKPDFDFGQYSLNIIGHIRQNLQTNTNRILKAIDSHIYIYDGDLSIYNHPPFIYDYLLTSIMMQRLISGFKK